MSALKSPELKPDQDFDYDEAVKMLDESTAAQEEGLTRLTDIEREKVTYILKYLGEEAQAAGASVDEILGTIEKYRLLLEMKQRQTRKLTGYPPPISLSPPSVRHALPEVSKPIQQLKPISNEPVRAGQGITPGGFSIPRPIASISSNMPMPIMTPASAQCPTPCATAAAAARPCVRQPSLAGTARGVIENSEDLFCGKTAVLRVFIPSSDTAEPMVRYSVGSSGDGIRFYASGRHVKVTRPDGCRNGLIISGEGMVHVQRPGQPDCTGKAAFSLAVQNTNRGLEFRMQIAAPDCSLAHDSGTVTVKYAQSDMCLRMS